MAVAACIAGLALFAVCDLASKVGTPARLQRTRERWRTEPAFMPERRDELPRFAVLAVSAGSCEEVAFRGHLIPYVTT